MLCSFAVSTPVFERIHYGKEFFVVDFVVDLCRGELP